MSEQPDFPVPFALDPELRDAYRRIAMGTGNSDSVPPDVLEQLLSLGLVTRGPEEGALRAADPAAAARRRTTRWRAQAATLEWQASALEEQFAPLAAQYQALARQPSAQGELELLEGHEAINGFIRATAAGAKRELITAQPGGGRGEVGLDAALQAALASLARGVAMRTLYQSTARFSETTRRYVGVVTEAGAQVRTSDDSFERLLVFDQEIALIPADKRRSSALVIRRPEICRYLMESFDYRWDLAVDFVAGNPRLTAAEVVPRVREQIKDLLLAGHTGETIARRVGLRPRAYQDHVTALKHSYNASTLVQLGYGIAMERQRAEQARTAPAREAGGRLSPAEGELPRRRGHAAAAPRPRQRRTGPCRAGTPPCPCR
ncbi:phospholipase D-like domain-containing protein [Streptacidiphilus rugosus]|uniref:hypothetical protein n=1 Tax=Streptacidiphilus rugosus TaxID=405783 RepID=UPI0012F9BBB3|nr:hypothetical protein [Streptacidiphilus rugosus]